MGLKYNQHWSVPPVTCATLLHLLVYYGTHVITAACRVNSWVGFVINSLIWQYTQHVPMWKLASKEKLPGTSASISLGCMTPAQTSKMTLTGAHLNSENLWQQVKDLQMFKTDNIPEERLGCAKVPHIAEELLATENCWIRYNQFPSGKYSLRDYPNSSIATKPIHCADSVA